MRWYFAAAILLFGVIVVDLESLKWGVLGTFIYAIPLLMQFRSSEESQIYSLWGGFFLILQTLISPALINSDFKTLKPNMHQIVNVRGGIPGIDGKQVITTDSRGFRTTKDIDYKNSNTYRIFAIGGSTTEQIYLDDRNTWTHLLQGHLSEKLKLDVEVINTGVSGLRAKHHLATLRNITGLHPDLVIFLMGVNDWNWHIAEVFSEESLTQKLSLYRAKYALKQTLLAHVTSLAYSSIKNSIKRHKEPSIKEEYGEYYSRQRNSLSRDTVYSFHPEDVHQEYKEELLAISNTCQENNIKCLFINQPTGYQKNAKDEFKRGFWMTPPNKPYTLDFGSMVDTAFLYNSFLLRFSREHGHYACDAASKLAPTFKMFYDDCHFNTAGAKSMSRIVGKCIEDFYQQQHRALLKTSPDGSF